VYLFRKVRPKWLILWGLASIAVASGLMLFAGLSMPFWPPAMMDQVALELKPPPEVIATEVATYQEGWLAQMDHRVPKSLEMEINTFLVWAAWRVSGLMLLGMALFKLGLFSATRSPKVYATLIAAALVIGIPVIAYGMQRNVAVDWDVTYFFFFGLQFNYWASILVSLGWVSVVMLVCQRARLGALTRPFAAVGRMAFTNYILQTVICTTIFYGHGFGLFGQVDRTGQAAIVVAVWVFILIISPIWLRYFLFGPLEWLWRSLVYLERQPFRQRIGTQQVVEAR
jgi:uncharacterized protein